MFIEAGILHRPKIGFFEIRKVAPGTAIARRAFDEAFFHWNPNLSQNSLPLTHPFYKYLEEA